MCAYLVCSKIIDTKELKKHLVDILPHYMIPNHFVIIDNIPLTLNHKVDRKALPEPKFNEISTSTKYIKPSTKIEKDLCSVFKTCLDISKIGIEDDIFDYHIDSLDIIQIQTKLLEYNYKLNTQDFYQYRTIKELSKLLENKNIKTICKADTDYLAKVNKSFYKYPNKMRLIKKHHKNILLLGCNGYLGMHLLREFIMQSNSNITCILRSKNNMTAIQRLSKSYEFYFNETLPINRISIIESDITKPHFGLSNEDYENLQGTIDLIINTAANVRYYGDYKKFKEINVDVVQNSIDFCMNNNIELVHISTLGVSGNYLVDHQKNYNEFSENDFYIGQQYDENVYIQTKFEAEKLIYETISKGLLASIIRVGNLTSRYEDGTFQKNFEENAFYNILMMILKYHILPDTMLNEFLEFTPIDYCAKAIYKLVTNVETNKYVFHLFNEHYIQVCDLLKIFKNIGFDTEISSGTKFKEEIIRLSNQYPEENILKGIVNDIDDTLGLSFKATVNQKNINTNSCLKDLNFEWPIIDDEYINKIIEYLRRKKFLK